MGARALSVWQPYWWQQAVGAQSPPPDAAPGLPLPSIRGMHLLLWSAGRCGAGRAWPPGRLDPRHIACLWPRLAPPRLVPLPARPAPPLPVAPTSCLPHPLNRRTLAAPSLPLSSHHPPFTTSHGVCAGRPADAAAGPRPRHVRAHGSWGWGWRGAASQPGGLSPPGSRGGRVGGGESGGGAGGVGLLHPQPVWGWRGGG